MYNVDALVYAEVTWNIVHLTEEHSLYKVDALVYTEVSWYPVCYFSSGSERNSRHSQWANMLIRVLHCIRLSELQSNIYCILTYFVLYLH